MNFFMLNTFFSFICTEVAKDAFVWKYIKNKVRIKKSMFFAKFIQIFQDGTIN